MSDTIQQAVQEKYGAFAESVRQASTNARRCSPAARGCGNPTTLLALEPGQTVRCIAGALEEQEYAAKLRAAGFVDVEVEPWRIYKIEDARAFLSESGVDVDRLAPEVEGTLASAFVRARKPLAVRSYALEGGK